MKTILASATFLPSANDGLNSSVSPAGPTMVTISTRSPATVATMSPMTLNVATTLIFSAAAVGSMPSRIPTQAKINRNCMLIEARVSSLFLKSLGFEPHPTGRQQGNAVDQSRAHNNSRP